MPLQVSMETKRTRVSIRQPHRKSSSSETKTALSSQRNVRDSCFRHVFSPQCPRVNNQHVHQKILSWFLQQTVLQHIDDKTFSRRKIPTRQTIWLTGCTVDVAQITTKVKLTLYRISQWHNCKCLSTNNNISNKYYDKYGSSYCSFAHNIWKWRLNALEKWLPQEVPW